MSLDLEKAQFMFALARRKGNWGKKYDRLEHFKRFPNLKQIIKELSKVGWIIIYHKPNYQAVSLNPEYKKEIMNFIEALIPYAREIMK